ncbi:hypothetical protein [Streptomyces sp. NPDC127100]|uniref:hypothetical protein n=1 Tax=Streptomyces sp. NPDC127100 TaxID=3347138 RepID=UPI00365374E8
MITAVNASAHADDAPIVSAADAASAASAGSAGSAVSVAGSYRLVSPPGSAPSFFPNAQLPELVRS